MPISPPQRGQGRHDAGFTLVELMVAVALLGILATIAIPSFTKQIESNRQRAMANQLQQVVRLASAQAAATGRPVVLCPSSDSTKCDGTWSNGWILFIDRDRNSIFNSSDLLLQTNQNNSNRQIKALGGMSKLVFRANGVNQSETFRICSPKLSDVNLEFEISPFGFSSLTKGITGGCS